MRASSARLRSRSVRAAGLALLATLTLIATAAPRQDTHRARLDAVIERSKAREYDAALTALRPLIADLGSASDPALLAEAEGPRRKLLDLPPYSSLARLTGDAAAVAAAAGSLRSAGGIGVSEGGDGAVLVRAPSSDHLADALARALVAGRPAGRLRAEMDPLRV